MTALPVLDEQLEHPSAVPGGLQIVNEREVPHSKSGPGGTITFEFAPAGYLTRDGDVRRSDWRAYFWTPLGGCEGCDGAGRVPGKREGTTKQCPACKGSGVPKRQRYASVTTLLDLVNPKGGLPVWAEARGIEGAVEAVRRGLIDPNDPASAGNAVEQVRASKLGADSARDQAATRGLNLHSLLEHYMLTGNAPVLAEHPAEHHGYVRALTRWLLKTDPQPVAVEALVAHPEDEYAGRMDLLAHVGGMLGAYDLKTQERGMIFRAAHVQVAMYSRAHVRCGGEPPFAQKVVVLAADGEFREQDCAADGRAVAAALAWWRASKPIDSVCESANRVERKAREAVAA